MKESNKTYDCILRNAHVIDPSQDIDQVLDIGIRHGRVAGLGPQVETASECDEVECSGKFLCPGLVDLHGHWYEGSAFGIDPGICLNHGVTTGIDAGTAGFVNFAYFRRHCIDQAQVRILAFLNIAACGIPTPLIDELEHLGHARSEDTADMIERNRPVIVGVKVRLGAMSADHPLEALCKALEAADSCGVPVMVHISKGARTPQVLARLRPGDIVTHCFQGRGDGIVLDHLVIPQAREARENGVLFDVGHGCGSFHWDTAKKAFEHFFYPDTISTDLHRYSVERFGFDMPTTMSKFLHLGMPLRDVVSKSTLAPAKAIGRYPDLGTLRPGAEADIFVFTVEEGEFPLEDTHFQTVIASRMIRSFLVVKGGRLIRPGESPYCLRTFYPSDHEVYHRLEVTA